jgi:hypothetical protein
MNNTYVETIPTDAMVAHLTTPYSMPNARQAPYWYDEGLFINGAGSTVSSATDLLQWIEAIFAAAEQVDANASCTTTPTRLEEALQMSLIPQLELRPGFGRRVWK